MADKVLSLRLNPRKQQAVLFPSDGTPRLTSAQSLHRDPNPYAVGSFQGVRSREVLTLRQLQLHQDERVWPSNVVLLPTEIILQNFTFIPAQLPWLRAPRALITQGKHKVAEGRNGELRALVRQMRRRANHGECSCKGTKILLSIDSQHEKKLNFHVICL